MKNPPMAGFLLPVVQKPYCTHPQSPVDYAACFINSYKAMQLIINGDPVEVPEQTSAAQLIEILELTNKRLAIEANRDIIPRSQFEQHIFQAGDQIEIVQAIGGG
jgi:sulfur carrier protein